MEHTSVLEPARLEQPLHVRELSEQSTVPAAIWQLWPGGNAPATAEDEGRFLARLEVLAALAPEPGTGLPAGSLRRHVTAVLNALRCGITVDDLLQRAPGLRPTALLAAHRHLDERRTRAVRAWESIGRARTIDALTTHGPVAAQVVPVVVSRLVTAAETAGARGLARAVEAAMLDMAALDAVCAQLEQAMAAADPVERAMLGRRLYDLAEPGLWSHDSFLPRRLGVLVPVRVAALLGER